jgi:hypothetical protein
VLRTFEINLKEVQRHESSSLLSEYTIKLSIQNIGVAFPLTLDQDLRLPLKGSPDSNAVRAFLFSIKSLDFGSHRGERGQAVMHGFSFQFVSRYGALLPFITSSHALKGSGSLFPLISRVPITIHATVWCIRR